MGGSLVECTSLGNLQLVLPTQCSHVHVRRPYYSFVHQPARLSAADTGIFTMNVVCAWLDSVCPSLWHRHRNLCASVDQWSRVFRSLAKSCSPDFRIAVRTYQGISTRCIIVHAVPTGRSIWSPRMKGYSHREPRTSLRMHSCLDLLARCSIFSWSPTKSGADQC